MDRGGRLVRGLHLELLTPSGLSWHYFANGAVALTGDALFIGDVGRPDLLASIGVTVDELGSMLYDSIQHKLMGLPDDVRVFPAHGAGSACGKNLAWVRVRCAPRASPTCPTSSAATTPGP